MHRGQVTGRCEPTTGIEPFTRLVKQVMTAEPYASADRMFWITDNSSSHRGAAAVARMQTAWPNAHLVHLPVHASWPDQTEIYFSVVQRKVVSLNDFTDLGQIRYRLAAFETRYNAVAEPFNWRFTRTDLNQLLERIDGRESHPTPHSGGHIRSRASAVAEQQRRAAQRGDQPFGVEVGEEQQPVAAVAHEVAGAAAEPDDRSNSRSCTPPAGIRDPGRMAAVARSAVAWRPCPRCPEARSVGGLVGPTGDPGGMQLLDGGQVRFRVVEAGVDPLFEVCAGEVFP